MKEESASKWQGESECAKEREGTEETEVGKKYNKMAMRTRRDALTDKS